MDSADVAERQAFATPHHERGAPHGDAIAHVQAGRANMHQHLVVLDHGFAMSLVPRLLVSLIPDDSSLGGEAVWTTTRIRVPDTCRARCYRHLPSGETVRLEDGEDQRWSRAADLSRTCAVGMLGAPSTMALDTAGPRGTREVS